VLLRAHTINGTGTVSANGGSGFQTSGAGGGGRLALHDFVEIGSALKLEVQPGTAVSGAMQAGVGTVYRQPAGARDGEGTLQIIGAKDVPVLTARRDLAAGTPWPGGVAKANALIQNAFLAAPANGVVSISTTVRLLCCCILCVSFLINPSHTPYRVTSLLMVASSRLAIFL
jgi:hypothetical protein